MRRCWSKWWIGRLSNIQRWERRKKLSFAALERNSNWVSTNTWTGRGQWSTSHFYIDRSESADLTVPNRSWSPWKDCNWKCTRCLSVDWSIFQCRRQSPCSKLKTIISISLCSNFWSFLSFDTATRWVHEIKNGKVLGICIFSRTKISFADFGTVKCCWDWENSIRSRIHSKFNSIRCSLSRSRVKLRPVFKKYSQAELLISLNKALFWLADANES